MVRFLRDGAGGMSCCGPVVFGAITTKIFFCSSLCILLSNPAFLAFRTKFHAVPCVLNPPTCTALGLDTMDAISSAYCPLSGVFASNSFACSFDIDFTSSSTIFIIVSIVVSVGYKHSGASGCVTTFIFRYVYGG